MKRGPFVYTSNIDNHFQRSGFAPAKIFEVHGSLCWMQCSSECGIGLFRSDPYHFEVGPGLQLTSAPPRCPGCGGLTRPNVVLYGDDTFDDAHVRAQQERYKQWRQDMRGASLCIIELGAGTTIPTVRHACEDAKFRGNGTLIRVNVHAPEGPDGTLSLGGRALDMLQRIDALLPGFAEGR